MEQPEKHQCNCELYYSDSAIRERCLVFILECRKLYPNYIYKNSIAEDAEAMFKVIKNGLNQEKQ